MLVPMALDPLLSRLVGTWRGPGHGEYPTISDFSYDDEMVFTDIGKPFLHFVERTRMAGEPRHTETGYWRAPASGVVEVVIAIPTGQAEMGSGTIAEDGAAVVIETAASVLNTPKAKRVDRIVRKLRVEGDSLHYELFMEAVGQGLTLHLDARLTRS